MQNANEDVAQQRLLKALHPFTAAMRARKELADAIEALLDAKIEAAIRDLDDKVNKRGEWDPDY